MKKTILAAIFAIITTCAFGQKIDYDKTNTDGIRIVSTEQAACRNMKDKIVLSTGLSVMTDQEQYTTYRLDIQLTTIAKPSEKFSICKDAKILIRTGDNSVLSLTCKEYKEDVLGTTSTVGGMVYNSKTILFSIDLTDDDIAHLSTGILKFRCEITAPGLNTDYFETAFKKPKNAEHLAKSYRILKNAISQKKSGDITDGF